MFVTHAQRERAGWQTREQRVNFVAEAEVLGALTNVESEVRFASSGIAAEELEDAVFDRQAAERLCQRLGVKNVTTHRIEENAEPPPGPFDAVLVDAPCSNTGVLGRRPEVRWRIKPMEFQHLIWLQTMLLLQAAERVKPRGTIVYSTCSIEPDENENVVMGVLRAMKNVKLEAEQYAIPGAPADGGYWARLRKA